MSSNHLIEKISQKTGLPKEQIQKLILEKQKELCGLVSFEGAAHIVGRELGVELIEKKITQIKDVYAGMRNINIKARVTKIFKKEFEHDGEKKQVVNVFLLDKTGELRLSLWNEQAELLDAREGDVVEIIDAYARKNIFGEIELRLGRTGRIKKVEDSEDIPKPEMIKTYTRERIDRVKEGGRYEIRACLVHIFESNPFFQICPECGSFIKDSKCEVHSEVKPEYTMILSGIIDDGYGNIRAVFFRETAEKLFGKTTEEAMKEINIFENFRALGKEFVFYGRIRRNQIFNRLELIVDDFNEINVEEEIEKLLKEVDVVQ
jgi:replication factor A1